GHGEGRRARAQVHRSLPDAIDGKGYRTGRRSRGGKDGSDRGSKRSGLTEDHGAGGSTEGSGARLEHLLVDNSRGAADEVGVAVILGDNRMGAHGKSAANKSG